MRPFFLESAKATIPRLLSLLDRSTFSENYGSFDRSYWWYRKSDFSSAIHQQAMLSLALAYNRSFSGNYLYKSNLVKQLIIQSFLYSLKRQHRDGSYDEWYPNERGWAGPTGYILYAQAATVSELREELSEQFISLAKQSFRSAIDHLLKHEEKDILGNHQLVALMAISQVKQVFPELVEKSQVDHLWSRVEKSVSPEGWILEYDGPDVGYLTGSLSFLARLHRNEQDTRYLNLAEKCLSFLSYYILPNGAFAYNLGSRNVNVPFFYGVEYWSNKLPIASSIADAMRAGYSSGWTPRLENMDDHYFLYRHIEFFEAGLLTEAGDFSQKPVLPCQKSEVFQKYFSESGLHISNNENSYFLIALKKGGSLVHYNKINSNIKSLAGIVAKLIGGAKTPNFYNLKAEVKASPNNQFTSSSGIHFTKYHSFSPTTFILFRFVQLALSRSAPIAKAIKLILRAVLMGTHPPKSKQFEISYNEKGRSIFIEYRLSGLLKSKTHLQFPAEFNHRFVPQSQYFTQFSQVQSFESEVKVEWPKPKQVVVQLNLEL